MAHYIGIAKQINEIKYFFKFYHDVKMPFNEEPLQRRKFTFQTNL